MMTKIIDDKNEAIGAFTTMDGERCYRISNFDRLPPFFMSIPSDTDLWMFISSNGGLAAGRIDADGSLFPYETVDKLHDAHYHTGPLTLFRVERRNDRSIIMWQPFSPEVGIDVSVERNLYKNSVGNRLVFEEINNDLGLRFRYRWSACDEFGLVRTATLENLGAEEVNISLLDGLRNVLPYGAPLSLHQQLSCLVDAYKRTDIDADTGMGIFSLTAAIIDRAEAAEVLRANTVWCNGLDNFEVHLAAETVNVFRGGEIPDAETVLTGRRGNYFVTSSIVLPAGAAQKWHVAADIGRSHVEISGLRAKVGESPDLDKEIEESLCLATDNLTRNVGNADGIQKTGDESAAVHHFANVLFNNMRGGVFDHNYDIPTADLIDFIEVRNKPVASRQKALLDGLSAVISLDDLREAATDSGDADFERLCNEYLPVYFGRRHGDPSRPWNRFAIHLKNPDGSKALRYEGNWRDIFQNWEALGMSYPGFIPSFIAKFVNASTVDGFNPYRITRDGVDWEVVDPDDPWSYIGYWGDHQIVYLLKFLEALSRVSPGVLTGLLSREIFSYADVPYRINSYEEVVENPNSTIVFDAAAAARIDERVSTVGTDGKLLRNSDGSVYQVSLFEKLLVPVLSKISNLVLDGGIWMNTQRPEWNDANNALVGNGVSMVTLCHLRRHISFLEKQFAGMADQSARVSTEVVDWFHEINSILNRHLTFLEAEVVDDRNRAILLDAVGRAFSVYRDKVYANGFSGKLGLPVTEVRAFCRTALIYLDHAIHANRREDGLYHSYNLLEFSSDRTEVSTRPLYEMLEGQVAALSSGLMDTMEATHVLFALFESRMYRADQNSFMLYPERKLPGFLEKNVVPKESVRAVALLRDLIAAGDVSVITRDAQGVYRFNSGFKNADDVDTALDRIANNDRWTERVKKDRKSVLDIFEDVFKHKSFTGRSGTMYGYEGLGCIYWHMVSKLLLAVQEIILRTCPDGNKPEAADALIESYFKIRGGLGFEKTATEYGAFPTDPYSHTPPHAGAQQPGMTGQVKEEILTRFGELGVCVDDGFISFRPLLLKENEFLKDGGSFRFYDIVGQLQSIDVPARGLAFSYCQTPIVYQLSEDGAWIRVIDIDSGSVLHNGNRLDEKTSRSIFARNGRVLRLDVGIPVESVYRPAGSA